MKVTLNDREIKEALSQYVGELGIDLNGKAVEVDLSAGRGPNGYSATIEITKAAVATVVPAAAVAPAEPADKANSAMPEPPVEDATEEEEPADTKSIFGK